MTLILLSQLTGCFHWIMEPLDFPMVFFFVLHSACLIVNKILCKNTISLCRSFIEEILNFITLSKEPIQGTME